MLEKKCVNVQLNGNYFLLRISLPVHFTRSFVGRGHAHERIIFSSSSLLLLLAVRMHELAM